MEGQFDTFDLLNMGGQYQHIHEDQQSVTYKVSLPQLNNWSIGLEISKAQPKVVLGLLEGNQIGDSIVHLYPNPEVLAGIKGRLPPPNNAGGSRRSKRKTLRKRR